MKNFFETPVFVFIGICVAILCLGLGASFGQEDGIKMMHTEAIKHHVAHYNPETAEFTWNQ